MNRWQWAIALLTRRMWFRASLFCLFAVALALAGALIGEAISYDFATKVGAKAVDNILNVLATSMLAVTTFSLTAMVSAYAGATSNITPRAVQLLVDDATAQNALATFLGSFLFAIVGIIALSTGIYGETGRVILYGGTVLVIVVIVITFLRWIEHITRFGRVGDTIDRVEKAATAAAGAMGQGLCFGPRPAEPVPDGATLIRHSKIGRVTHVDTDAIAKVADETGAPVMLTALPGNVIEPWRPLAWTAATLDDKLEECIREAFTISHNRAYDHDPRFGLVVLSEIGSRALSPAVNDGGTAIAVLEAGTRVLAAMLRLEAEPKEEGEKEKQTGVRVPPFAFSDLLEDLFHPIARDGAGSVEVGIRLQKSLAALQVIAPEARSDCRNAARNALERACAALTNEKDRDRVKRVHDRFWFDGLEAGKSPPG